MVQTFFKTYYNSPLGKLTLVSDGKSLTGLYIEGQKYFNCPDFAKIKDDLDVFKNVKLWLEKYFKGKKPDISKLPLAPEGSPFRQEVWEILCKIPYGKTTTYGDIARDLARKRGVLKMSAQAVGGAVGHNPVSIIIPCHRVLGKNGSLTGYAGGIEKKIKLLELEGVNFSIPNKKES